MGKATKSSLLLHTGIQSKISQVAEIFPLILWEFVSTLELLLLLFRSFF